MPFPETKRVIYKKNPLNKVICQLRFPPILKIESNVPSDFQDAIRTSFPLYEEKIEIHQEAAIGIKNQISPDIVRQLTKSVANKNHQFASEDRVRIINLTRTSLSLMASKYHRWEEFISGFKTAIDALLTIYTPPFFTRIGLLYVDIFDRNVLGISDLDWKDLIKPQFLGLLSTDIRSDIRSCENIYEIQLEDKMSIVRIETSFVLNFKTKEKCFMVNSDFNCPRRVEISEMNSKLGFLHEHATRLIQWLITDRMHNAMEPEDI